MPSTIEPEYAEAEPTQERLVESVRSAQVDVRELLRSFTDGEPRAIRDIQDLLSHWRGTLIDLAVLDLCRRGEVALEADLTVRIIALRED